MPGNPAFESASEPERDRLAPAGLSAREEEVLVAWLLTETKSEVARRLFISIGTVNTHLTRARDKYEAVGRSAGTKAALVARALQDGLVRLDQL